MDAVRTTNYWSAARSIGADETTFDKNFFDDGQATYTAPEWNDLANPRGILPDDRWGVITGLFVTTVNTHNIPAANLTAAIRESWANRALDLYERLNVELYVGGVQICRGPMSMFGSPGPWQAGTPNAGLSLATTNSGFLLQFTPHEIHPRASIRVRIYNKVTLTGITAPTQGNMQIVTTIQTVDQKTVFSGR